MQKALRTNEKKRNIWLDLYKIFLAFLVVCIHFTGDAYGHMSLYRIAVPSFFFISGYFSYHEQWEKAVEKAKGAIWRTLKYLLIGFAVYIVYDFIMCYFDGKGVGYYFTTLFYENFLFQFVFWNQPITYTGYQLWFLIALLVTSIYHFLLVRFRKEKWYRAIIPVCLAIYFFFQGYMHLFQETDMPIRYTRNALFMGLPLFGFGYLSAGLKLNQKPWQKYVYLVLGIAFWLFGLVECRLVTIEMYPSTVLAVFFLTHFFLGLKGVRADGYYRAVGKNASFYLYIFHVAVGVLFNRFIVLENFYLRSVSIFAISLAIYLICFWVWRGVCALIRRRQNRPCNTNNSNEEEIVV